MEMALLCQFIALVLTNEITQILTARFKGYIELIFFTPVIMFVMFGRRGIY